MSRRVLLLLGFAATLTALGWIGHELLFTTFMLYDDEGYVLLTLRDFGRHGGLYEVIFTQYGPFFYVLYDGLQRLLDLAWTSTSGRWITLVNWLGTAGFCAVLLLRARAHWAFALFVLADAFTYLWIMIHEPMHPGSTITLLVAAAAWLGFEALRAGRPGRFAVVLGAIGAALALTKINVGAFLILSTIFWFGLSIDRPVASRIRLVLVGLGFLLPLALMRSLLAEGWIQVFAGLSGLATASALLAVGPTAQEQRMNWRPWLIFAGTGLLVTALVVGAMALRGSTPAALWHGVIVAPLQHPGVYSFPVRWRPGVLLVGLAALVLVWQATRRPEDGRLRLAIAWSRIVATVLFQLTLLPAAATSQAAIGLCYGLPLAGLFAIPLGRAPDDLPGRLARGWLALLLVLQSLHAYPVAGSQLNWGTFLWVPLMLLGLQEALATVAVGRSESVARRFRLAPSFAAVALTVSLLVMLGNVARHNRRNGEAIAVPGAETIILPAPIASALRVVAENCRAHAAMLLSLPGSYSLNLWSDSPTPTPANATHWFSLLSPAQQAEMLARLEAEPRAVFVVQHNILAALIESGFRPSSPVLEYLRANYRRAFAIEGYSFWVLNGRTIAPLSTGTLQLPATPDAPHRVELTLAARTGPVAAVELWNVTGGQWQLLALGATNTHVRLTPLALDGQSLGGSRPAAWPFALDGITRVGLEFFPLKPLPPAETIEAVLFDASGRRLGAARILPSHGFVGPLPVSAAVPPGAD